MDFRFLLLFALLGLGACDGSESSTNGNTSTFDVETAATKAKLDGHNSEIAQKTAALTAAGTKLAVTEQADAALTARIQHGEQELALLLAEAGAATKQIEADNT